MPSDRRVVVTGVGMVSPFGSGVDVAWESIVSGQTATRHVPWLEAEHGLPVHVAALVPRVDDDDIDSDRPFDASCVLTNTRTQDVGFISLALGAASEALGDSGVLDAPGFDPRRAGVAMGAGVGSLAEVTSAFETLSGPRGLRRLSPFFVPRTLVNLAAGHVSMAFDLRGPNHCVATARDRGPRRRRHAYRFVRFGADVMVAGGTESTVDALSVAGFSRAKALSKCSGEQAAEASRPFDARRDGFVMGEGAGALVLEEYEHAKARGARVLAEIRGYGLSGDAHHITAPASDGDGAKRCMTAALSQAGLTAEDVGYVNAHATSTPLGDAIEARDRRGAVSRRPRQRSSSVLHKGRDGPFAWRGRCGGGDIRRQGAGDEHGAPDRQSARAVRRPR